MNSFKDIRETYSEGELSSEDEQENHIIDKPQNIISHSHKQNNIWSDVIKNQELASTLDKSVHINGVQRSVNLGVETYYTLPEILPIMRANGKTYKKACARKNRVKKIDHSNNNDTTKFYYNATSYKRLKKNNGFKPVPEEIIKHFGEQTLAQRRRHVIYKLNGPKPKAGYDRFYSKLGIKSDIDQSSFIEIMAKYMEESNIELLTKITEKLGIQKTSEILCECDAIQNMGGLYTLDGKRKRTFGGVFIIMVKTDVSVKNDIKKEIFDCPENYHKPPLRKVKATEHNNNISSDIPPINGHHADNSHLNGNPVETLNGIVPQNTENIDFTEEKPVSSSNPCYSGGGISLSGTAVEVSTNSDNLVESSKVVNTMPHSRWKRKIPCLPVEIRRDNRYLYMTKYKRQPPTPNEYSNSGTTNGSSSSCGSKERAGFQKKSGKMGLLNNNSQESTSSSSPWSSTLKECENSIKSSAVATTSVNVGECSNEMTVGNNPKFTQSNNRYFKQQGNNKHRRPQHISHFKPTEEEQLKPYNSNGYSSSNVSSSPSLHNNHSSSKAGNIDLIINRDIIEMDE